MNIIQVDPLKLKTFRITGKGKTALQTYQKVYNPRKISEFCKIRGIDYSGSKVLIALKGNDQDFDVVRKSSGLTTPRVSQVLSELLKTKMVKVI